MFIIRPKNGDDCLNALVLLSKYYVDVAVKNHHDNMYIEVTEGGCDPVIAIDNLRLCEMAFQMNFRQGGNRLCVSCHISTYYHDDFCGHLTFTSTI